MTSQWNGRTLHASVIVCAYTEARWETIVLACESARGQLCPGDELVLVVDHNPALAARARQELEGVAVSDSTGPRGLSGARNHGVSAARGDVLVFLDDDAVPEPRWLDELLAPYADPAVVGVGGAAVPEFQARRPRWLPSEYLWVVGCTYTGVPATQHRIRNPIGANMSFRRIAFDRAGPFSTELGRIGALPVGCEETELAIRVRRALPGSTVLHQPTARVRHHVPASRLTLRYFTSRCWSEGVSKAAVSRLQGMDDALESEFPYVTRVLSRGVARGLAEAVRGDAGGLQRACAIIAGLALASGGYARGLARR